LFRGKLIKIIYIAVAKAIDCGATLPAADSRQERGFAKIYYAYYAAARRCAVAHCPAAGHLLALRRQRKMFKIVVFVGFVAIALAVPILDGKLHFNR
jgi:hypothetical protein